MGAREQALIIQGMLTRGWITKSDASKKMQMLTVEGFQTREMEHFEPYGLTGRPPNDAEAIVARLRGTGEAICLVAADRSVRPLNLAKKDVTVYDGHGNRIDLSSSGVAINNDTTIVGNAVVTKNVDAATHSTSTVPGVDFTGVPTALTVKKGLVTSAAGGDVTMPGFMDAPSYKVAGVPGWSGSFQDLAGSVVTVASGLILSKIP